MCGAIFTKVKVRTCGFSLHGPSNASKSVTMEFGSSTLAFTKSAQNRRRHLNCIYARVQTSNNNKISNKKSGLLFF